MGRKFLTKNSTQLIAFICFLAISLSFLVSCSGSPERKMERETVSYTINKTDYETAHSSTVEPSQTVPAPLPIQLPLPIDQVGDLTIHCLDVGQGQATLLKQGDYEILIDGGGQDRSSFVVSYLKELGVETIDLMIATHFDDDHIAGLIGVMNVFPVEQILYGSSPKDTRACHSFIQTSKDKNIPALTPVIGDRFVIGSMVLNIVGPLKYHNEDNNDDSIISKINFSNTSILIGGDTSLDVEQDLVYQDLKADLMLANHHGSKDSNSKSWLERISPQFVVISCGANNTYGFPSQETLSRIKMIKAEIFRTDELGTILFRSDGKTITPLTKNISEISETRYPENTVKEVDTGTSKTARGQSGLAGAVTREISRPEETIPTTDLSEEITEKVNPETSSFVLNVRSKKFHKPGCSAVAKMKAKNRLDTIDTRDNIINQGYQPCKICNP